MDSDALIAARHQALEGVLDERQRRLHAAVEAKVLGQFDLSEEIEHLAALELLSHLNPFVTIHSVNLKYALC